MTNDSEKTVQRMRRANPVPDPASLHADPHDAAALFASITQRRDVAAHSTKEKAMKSRDQVSSPFYRRPLAVAIAAGMAVIALIVPIALMSRTEPGIVAEPATTVSIATAVIPSTTVPETVSPTTAAPQPVEAAVPVELAMTWERAPLDAVLERAWMRSVTTGGPGLVAVGSTEQMTAAVWLSEDGRTWERIESSSFVAPASIQGTFGEHERFMSDVAATSSGLVAIGGDVSYVDGDEEEEMVVWHSADGVEWTEVGGSAFAGGIVNAVAAGGPGYVAVGAIVEDGQPAVWVSVDGRVWERIGDESLAPGADYASAELNDVTAAGPGLVAVGCEIPQTDNKYDIWTQWHPGIWVSFDGRAWDRLSDAAVVDPEVELERRGNVPAGIPTCPASVIASDDGLVALGDWGDRVWLSTDGYEWTITQSFVPSWNTNRPFLTSVAASGDRVIGAGAGDSLIEHPGRSMYPPHYLSATFLSFENDTGTWYRVDQLEAIDRTGMVNTGNWDWNIGVVDDIVAFGDGFVAVGHNGVYDAEPNEELDRNWCGFEDEWTGSCRTDAAVWIGAWGSEG